jgi:hypothetical protein
VSICAVRPVCCHEMEGMFSIPDDRRFRRGEMTGLALGIWDFLKIPAGLQFGSNNPGEVDRQVRNLLSPSSPRRLLSHGSEPLALQAAVSPPATV